MRTATPTLLSRGRGPLGAGRRAVRPARSARALLRAVRADGVPAVVWLVVALQLTVCLLQTAVFPHGRSPDEAKQVDLVLQVADGRAWPWPGPGEAVTSTGVQAGTVLPPDRLRGRAHLADQETLPRDQRPSWTDAGGAEPWPGRGGAPLLNQLVQHPPLYYLLGATVAQAVPDRLDVPFDRTWMVLRWVGALLVVPLPLLAWATARRLRLPDPLPVAAALAVVAVPEMAHLASAVNNDNLVVLLGAVATWLGVRVLTGDLTLRTGAALGAVTSLALLTKGFALLLPAWVLLVYAVAAWRRRSPAAAGSALVSAAAMLPGLAWWVRNVVVHGTLQPHGTRTDQTYLAQAGATYRWADGGAEWLARLGDRMVTLFFVQDQASLMRQDASWWAARAALVVLVTGLVVTLVRRTVPRLDAVVLLVPAAGLLAIVAKGSYEQFTAFGNVAAAQQGRYLYMGAVGMLVTAVAGAAVLRPGLRQAVPAAVLTLGLALHTAFHIDAWWVLWAPAGASGLPAAVASVDAMVRLHAFGAVVLAPLALTAAALLAAVGTWTVRTALADAAETAGARDGAVRLPGA
ncbi:hypothetical protein DNL40_05570 [Xylanimonas oleitrophica]|uniref:DUF2142 domain-containing protein n=1 Tax=Xylanimonas oleitrophica TaxID=2607479 RepID=A0A2W5Y7J9_9MICO|nr:glycosyltransferase family 39 protein [Xylanimonas oleitrophica]PZR54364.1 hypothetical protein DNL40_05570 [Xylanimonas oleitrophica]